MLCDDVKQAPVPGGERTCRVRGLVFAQPRAATQPETSGEQQFNERWRRTGSAEQRARRVVA